MKIYVYKGCGYSRVYVCTYHGDLEKLVAHLKSEFPRKMIDSEFEGNWANVWIQ